MARKSASAIATLAAPPHGRTREAPLEQFHRRADAPDASPGWPGAVSHVPLYSFPAR